MKYFSACCFLLFLLNTLLLPCTTAIVSAKAAKDGRPLLLKNRDSDFEFNSLVFNKTGKYSFTGLINAADSKAKEVWTGINSMGFAIMNSASYNLKPESDTTSIADREGIVMREALQNCATVDDFEKLLQSMPKPLGVEANFGVIDAFGGAAYFETDNFAYKKYDVNDLAVAPDGYLIRTNYSCSGDPEKGAGHIRFVTATELFKDAYKKNGLTVDFLLHDVARCLYHSATGIDAEKIALQTKSSKRYIPFQDFIPRHSTSAVLVVEGVKAGENANLTTMWAALGFSLATVAVPVWNNEAVEIPKILQSIDGKPSAMSAYAVAEKRRLFSYKGSEKERYINIKGVTNKAKTGAWQKALKVETQIIAKAKTLVDAWRKKGMQNAELSEFYHWTEALLTTAYLK